ncbi:MAG: hypothetical protein ACYS9C_03640 [Planctomycetota bacterium]|jgi:hypothetical protein
MDENEDKGKQAESGCDSSAPDCGVDCCSPSAGGGKSWKTVVFVVVILLAGAVAAHSLLTGNGETTDISQEGASFSTTGLSGETESSTECPATSEQLSETVAVSCGVTLDSIESLGKSVDESRANVVFVFLPGENDELNQAISAQIEAAMNMLSAKGKQMAVFTLQRDSAGYDQMIEQFSVESLPSVIVAGKGCGAATISGEITETKLLRAFVVASTPISCGPGGCCPSGPR